MKILIMGLPGSGKSTLAEPLAKQLQGVWVNADAVRKEYDDWDFTPEGRIRQANRMRYISDGIVMAGKTAIADFICPTREARMQFDPDYIVWLDTIKRGRYDDTNKMFEPPELNTVNYHVAEWFTDTHAQLAGIVKNWTQRQMENNDNAV